MEDCSIVDRVYEQSPGGVPSQVPPFLSQVHVPVPEQGLLHLLLPLLRLPLLLLCHFSGWLGCKSYQRLLTRIWLFVAARDAKVTKDF